MLDKFYSLAEHSEVASRIDPTPRVRGISYPQFMDRGRRGFVWYYENMDRLTVGDMLRAPQFTPPPPAVPPWVGLSVSGFQHLKSETLSK